MKYLHLKSKPIMIKKQVKIPLINKLWYKMQKMIDCLRDL
jgi:hypothetical protein